jgi:hypothetical protein
MDSTIADGRPGVPHLHLYKVSTGYTRTTLAPVVKKTFT